MNTALRAFQTALDVTGHNITNVNTAGYTRQTVGLADTTPTNYGNYMLGNGVSISGVTRIQSAFLAARQLANNSDGSRAGSLLGGLQSIEGLTQEPGGAGIGTALDALYNAFSALGSNPNQASLMTQVQQAGSTLSSRVRNLYNDLRSQSTNAGDQISQQLDQAQDLANQIAHLNAQIREQQGTGSTPNDLLDMRDQKLQELSGIVDIHVQLQPDGSANVYMNQLTLVDQAGARQMPTNFDATTGTISDANGSYQVKGGQVAGLMGLMRSISSYQGKLDTLANTLRTQFNSIHQTGTNALGNTGVNFFNDANPQTGAINFGLDPAVAADAKAIAAGSTGAPGDGGIALSLSGLRDTKLPSLGNATMGAFYSDFIGGVATDTAFAKTDMDTKSAIATQIDAQVQSISGVNLDEEMSNMLRFQRSYQAAARALSVFDQTTEDLINLIR